MRRRTVVGLVSGTIVVAAVLGVLWRTGHLLPAVSPAVALADSSHVADGDTVAVPVEVAAVARRSIAAYYRAASVVDADRLVDLTAKLAGRVQSIACEEGDWVSAGQVLAELENERQKVQLRQAELKLAEQQRLRERNRQMLAEQLISQQEYDDAQSRYALAETERDLARIAVDETIMRAPFAGQITARHVVLGQQLPAATVAFSLADASPLRVRVHLPEAVARKVAVGQEVLVQPEADDAPLRATVERVSPVVDPQTSTVQVTMRLPAAAGGAMVGGFVKVRVTTDRHADALAIPKTALVETGGLKNVFVAAADTVRKLEVTTGLYDDTHIEVVDGLQEGWQVVTLGQGSLHTGTRVEILPPDSLDTVAAK